MRTLEEIDADIQIHTNALAALASERGAIKPNPIKVKIIPGAKGITISKG